VPVAAAIHAPHGHGARPVIHAGKAYVVAADGDLLVADVGPDSRIGEFRTVASLPAGANNAVRTVAFGADGMLAITGDAATSYAWDPATGELWCRSRLIEPLGAPTAPQAGVTRAVLALWQ
jgi:glucose/arabinose dehydrogenase